MRLEAEGFPGTNLVCVCGEWGIGAHCGVLKPMADNWGSA